MRNTRIIAVVDTNGHPSVNSIWGRQDTLFEICDGPHTGKRGPQHELFSLVGELALDNTTVSDRKTGKHRQVINHPLPFGTKVGVDSPRHEFTVAYLAHPSKVHGGGHRYTGIFVPSGQRANVYDDEISVVLTKNVDATVRWLARS